MTRQTKKSQHPVQGDVPEIDRENAETLPEIPPAMPTAENAMPSMFKPGNGISTIDMMEITLMYLLQLSNTEVTMPPGALRTQLMSAERVAMLSPEAQRWMKQLQPAPSEPEA